MKELLTINFWFNLRSEPLSKGWQIFLLIIFIALIGLVIYIELNRKKIKILNKKLLSNIWSFSLVNGLISAWLALSHNQLLPIFTARFCLAIWVIEMTLWLFFIVRRIIRIKKHTGEKISDRKKQEELKKYLPK